MKNEILKIVRARPGAGRDDVRARESRLPWPHLHRRVRPQSRSPSGSGRTTFRGGREYELTSTRPASTAQNPLHSRLRRFRQGSRQGEDPQSDLAFRDLKPGAGRHPAATRRVGTKLILRTDLEPDVAKTQAEISRIPWATTRDLLFERLTNFGGTVASETRTLALIATLASWVIIIVYLWWRFHSFTYGLAAVLAVVHDVLITLGAIAISYWLAKIPGLNTFSRSTSSRSTCRSSRHS